MQQTFNPKMPYGIVTIRPQKPKDRVIRSVVLGNCDPSQLQILSTILSHFYWRFLTSVKKSWQIRSQSNNLGEIRLG